MKKRSVFRNIVAKSRHGLVGCVAVLSSLNSYAQTNPTAQTLPVSQNFGTATFTSLPAGFAGWTSGSSPSSTQANAESSTASGDATISAATGTQTTGGMYGYASGSDASPYIQTSSNATNGTDQLAVAIVTTNLGNIAVSYDVKMISANPRTIGVELQYRTGTSGSWTSVSGTVYSHTSSDRSNGAVDNFSITLPTGADNNSVVQLRWITWRGTQTGNSSGISIDNISISATALNTYYFRSKQSGAWNSASTWEYSPNNSTWSNAAVAPRYTANTVTVQSSDSVSITNSDTLDQIVVNGILKYEDLAVTPVIRNGTGSDLIINGKFYDAGPNSITWLSGATWSMGSSGYLIRNRGTSATNWRDKYDGGISNIPATAYWIVRKNSSDTPLLSSTGGMYYPNLKIENYTVSGWTTGTNSSFSGSSNTPIVKGSLYIGGDGSNTVSFLNSNTYTNPVLVYGNLTLKSGSTMRCQGTGYEVQGDLALNGTMDYTGGGAFIIKLSGSANQNLSGTLNFNNLELNKTSTLATVTLQAAATVSGGLSFVKGLIHSSSTNLLTFKHHSSVGNAGGNNTNDSSFVIGPVKKIGNSAFTFPIGKGHNYQSIRISAPSDTTDAFTAEYFDTTQTLGTATDPTFDYVSSCEYFNLARTTGTSNVSVTLAVDMSSCVTNLFPDPRVIGWDGSKWADLGQGSFTFTTFSGTIASDGPLSTYGAITLGNNSSGTTLPPDTAYIPTNFRYIKNAGQLADMNDSLRPDIKYYINSVYPNAFFTDSVLHYVFSKVDTVSATTDTVVRIDVSYLNSNTTKPVAQHVDSTYTNYYFAHCSNGVTSVPQYQRLTYGKLYQNIDLVYAQSTAGIKFAFDMRAGAKADVIRARYTGTDSVKVLGGGELRIYTALGNLTFSAPHAFQVDSSENTVPVSCEWYVDNDTEVIFTFPVGYNQHLPLAIVVEQGFVALDIQHAGTNHEWEAYFGNTGDDEGMAVSTDTDGNAYFTGKTNSTLFPVTSGAFQYSSGGMYDAYIAKFDKVNYNTPEGDNKVWATFFGSEHDDYGLGIVNKGNGSTGKVYITGMVGYGAYTMPLGNSGNYIQDNTITGKNAFILGLNNSTGNLDWLTFFGGNGDDIANCIAKDNSNNIYIAGSTTTPQYSATSCAEPNDGYFPTCNPNGNFHNSNAAGGGKDAFIAEFDNSGTLLYSTFFGGTGDDEIETIAIDGSSNVFVGGKTTGGTGFPFPSPLPSGKYNQNTYGGGSGDGFVAKLNNVQALTWSTFYGGDEDDEVKGLDVDASGSSNIFITGRTASLTPACSTCTCAVPGTGEFPLCNPGGGAKYQAIHGNSISSAGYDAFIGKFSNTGQILWSTYYGGEYDDVATGIVCDAVPISSGAGNIDVPNVVITGQSYSDDFSTQNPVLTDLQFGGNYLYLPVFGTDVMTITFEADPFIAMFKVSGEPLWSTNYGDVNEVGNDRNNAITCTKSITPAAYKQWYLTGFTDHYSHEQVQSAYLPNPYGQIPQNVSSTTKDAVNSRFANLAYFPAGIAEKKPLIDNGELLIYPNPSSDNIFIEGKVHSTATTIKIYDIIGREVYSEKIETNTLIRKTINISNWVSGIYIVQLVSNESKVSKKFIKQ